MLSASARVTRLASHAPSLRVSGRLQRHTALWRTAPTFHRPVRQRRTLSVVMSGNGSEAKNVLGGPLQCCCKDPVTGFTRDGYCKVVSGDTGVHAVCAQVTDEFLEYTKQQGNDLSTPRPPHFPGLKNGSKWCLCASRWKQAHEAGKAPKIFLEATDAKALEYIDMELLKQYAVEEA